MRRQNKRPPAGFDENPEWTKRDFDKGKSPSTLPAPLLKQFKKHRGPQKSPTKVATSIRLSRDVLEHFKAKGPGWQTRVDETLRKAARLKAP